jgi:hypothetical protein
MRPADRRRLLSGKKIFFAVKKVESMYNSGYAGCRGEVFISEERCP